MPNVTFFIDKSNLNKDNKAPIKANVTLNYKNITRIVDYCNVSDWNNIKQRVRPPKTGMKDNGHQEINEKLDRLQDDFKSLLKQLEGQDIPLTPELVKRFLKGENIDTGQKRPFWEAYKQYLSLLNVAPKTLQNYTLYYTKLQEFEKETGYVINYSTINQLFLDNYKKYILEIKKLGWNTLATAIKKLRFFMAWSYKRQYHQEIGFKILSLTERLKTHISLTEAELITLYNFDFKNDRLNNVRDIFCFSCLTGLPYSDFKGLTHEHINNGILTKYRQKTMAKMEQPLSEAALNIIARHKDKYYALPRISSQKLNSYIKEICKGAGIDTPTVYKDFSGGKTTEKIAPKYELISSHAGRRTFATIYYNNTGDSFGVQRSAGMSAKIMEKHYFGIKIEQAKENMNRAFHNIKTKGPDLGPEREDYVI